MLIYVDIDETICYYEGERRYDMALPIPENVEKINKLFDEGHTIVYWTARGSVTKINWHDITENQLQEWGCKYHNLITGEKPPYDLIICDKSKRIQEL